MQNTTPEKMSSAAVGPAGGILRVCQFLETAIQVGPYLPLPVSESTSTLCATPPDDSPSGEVLSTGLHVFKTMVKALEHVVLLYTTDPVAREGFFRAVGAITTTVSKGAKTVVIGVGKSGKIGQKIVATMNSLNLTAMFMHPTEALHGDLGAIKPNDAILLISYSGTTPEILALLPHLPSQSPLIALTSHTANHTSALTQRPSAILLPAPIPESEESSFGIGAPTISTTVALVIGDALAVAAARSVHQNPQSVFQSNHPGGAIGAMASTG